MPSKLTLNVPPLPPKPPGTLHTDIPVGTFFTATRIGNTDALSLFYRADEHIIEFDDSHCNPVYFMKPVGVADNYQPVNVTITTEPLNG